MSVTPPRALLGRVSAGGWTAVIWCAAAAVTLRGYTGLPGMPHGLPALPPGSWALVGAAIGMALAGSTFLSRRPLPALGLLIAGCCAMTLAMSPVRASNAMLAETAGYLLALDVAFAFVVATRPRWTWIVAFAMLAGVLPAADILRLLIGHPAGYGSTIDGRWTFWLAYAVMPAVVAGLLGYSIRQTRQYAQRLSAHAVTAERLRISRELHDMVAHSMGIITLQAGAAARILDTQPDRAREAMTAVEATGRQTLSGLRRMLTALRETESGQAPENSPLHPAPGLADIDELAAATTAVGVRVDVRWRGERRALPPEVDLSAYRIIQESLTNVVRHADTRSCEVSVDYRDEELAIAVTDYGRGSHPATTGYGLVGMRERVALLHGIFTAGSPEGGGFQVTARLPVPGAAAVR